MKKCRTCQAIKALEQFHKDRAASDGKRGVCKGCVKINTANSKEQFKAYRARYNAQNSEKSNAYLRRYRAANAAKRHTHQTVTSAIRSGQLIAQPCEVCGKVKVDAHHDDYTRPLHVRWLCRLHHMEHHARENAKTEVIDQ